MQLCLIGKALPYLDLALDRGRWQNRSVSLRTDPLLANSRREAIIILTVWATCLLYTTGYCYLFGYLSYEPMPEATGPALNDLLSPGMEGRDPGSLWTPLSLGIPDWVFFGILTPWLCCIAFTLWFCFAIFKEDDLPEPSDEGENGAV